ncbi:MAG: family 43 glycosylhydrolase [Limisphaerales bacterium]
MNKSIKNSGFLTFAAGTAVVAAAIIGTTCLADNPVVQTSFTADPAPMVYDGTLYLYTSHDENDAFGFKMLNWKCYTTTDMVNWTDHGSVASLTNFPWAAASISGWGGFSNGAWAPQCIERNGKFYMFCPLQGRGIGVLVSDSPFGPFTDPLGKPLIGGQYDSIDPTEYIDDDGQAYLYWGNPNLWYVKLNKDMISYSGAITKDPSFAKVRGKPDPFHYQEGPWFYKRNGHYYMAYASTCCPEGIGYAMSTNATGPWTYGGYIMRPNPQSSGNHPGIIDYKGNSYVFGFNYALNYALTPIHRERRSVCVALMTYNADGTIPTVPWWNKEGVPQIGTFNPYAQTSAATICWESGVTTLSDTGGQLGVVYVSVNTNSAYIKVKGVDFGSDSAKTFTASVADGDQSGVIELHLDDTNGTLIGSLPVPNTGGSEAWQMKTAVVSGATGVHDLYFVFTGQGDGHLFNVDYWKFDK